MTEWRRGGLPVVMVHENDLDRRGCEFGRCDPPRPASLCRTSPTHPTIRIPSVSLPRRRATWSRAASSRSLPLPLMPGTHHRDVSFALLAWKIGAKHRYRNRSRRVGVGQVNVACMCHGVHHSLLHASAGEHRKGTTILSILPSLDMMELHVLAPQAYSPTKESPTSRRGRFSFQKNTRPLPA